MQLGFGVEVFEINQVVDNILIREMVQAQLIY